MGNTTLKKPSEYYTQRVMFNLTEDQRKSLDAAMKAHGYTSLQRYFREVLVGAKRIKQTTVMNSLQMTALTDSQTKDFKNQLAKIGSNVNQAVTRINQFVKKVSEDEEQEYNIRRLLDLEKRLLWYLGRLQELCDEKGISGFEEEDVPPIQVNSATRV